VITKKGNPDFIPALLKEVSLRKDYLEGEKVSTVYFGGGTPSVFSVEEIGLMMSKLREFYETTEDAEVTIELNPDDVTPEYVSGLHKLGINRISLGIQSWRDKDLRLLNRRHDAIGAENALRTCINEGFENITIDLIYGIPGMSVKEWESNLDFSFSFDIKHFSAYHLTMEQGTVFSRMLKTGAFREIDEELSAELFNLLLKKSAEAGFVNYEISNFGKPGFFSRHNTNYWKQVNYLGLGPSAHSFNGYSRQWNKSDLKGYIESVNSGKPDFESEELDARTRFNEYIMTSLRTMWGIDLDFVEATFDKEGYDYVINMFSKFKQYGLMSQDKNNLVLTDQGKLISDNIISEFMMA
jgi:oxygen-independent coproporphyrinogen-3 oxidase